MDTLINFGVKWSGLGWALQKMDGYKVYIGGAMQMLTGLGAAAGGLLNLLGEIMPLHTAAEYWHFVKELSHDSNMAIIAGGLGLMGKGLADIGHRHALDKQTGELLGTTPPAPPVAP